jgi:hypothetical protein
VRGIGLVSSKSRCVAKLVSTGRNYGTKVPDTEVEILLPLPTNIAGVAQNCDYPFNLEQIGVLVQLGIDR